MLKYLCLLSYAVSGILDDQSAIIRNVYGFVVSKLLLKPAVLTNVGREERVQFSGILLELVSAH
jgi:hypothetical protein